MMEFTFDGIVRQGFGFYNPNHAAAFLCAIMPFLWSGWLRWANRYLRFFFASGTFAAVFMLSLTLSRSGFAVLIAELILFAWLKPKARPPAVWCSIFFVLILLSGGLSGRLTLDRAITNRPEIWLAGMQLFAANPLTGVGCGNSGLLVSQFLLSPEIQCRTLVNTHLTLAAEYGFAGAFLWVTLLLYACLGLRRAPTAGTAFVGLCLSAGVASIFDFDLLTDFSGYGGLTFLNYVLSWFLFLLFLGLGIGLAIRQFSKWEAGIAVVGALSVCLCLLFFQTPDAPRVDGKFIIAGRGEPLILHDGSLTLRELHKRIPREHRLAIRSCASQCAPKYDGTSVWLVGECAAFAVDYPDMELTFVYPPESFEFPGNAVHIYLKPFSKVLNLPSDSEVFIHR